MFLHPGPPKTLPHPGSSRSFHSNPRRIPVLDIHELAAGKLAALLTRNAGRDLFDAHQLLSKTPLEGERLRLAFVIYGAMSRKDWRTVSAKDAEVPARELRDKLYPLLRRTDAERIPSIKTWARELSRECRQSLSAVLPLSDREREFLDRILDHGQIEGSLLTSDPALLDRIRRHPGLEWKAQNVREYKRRRGSP